MKYAIENDLKFISPAYSDKGDLQFNWWAASILSVAPLIATAIWPFLFATLVLCLLLPVYTALWRGNAGRVLGSCRKREYDRYGYSSINTNLTNRHKAWRKYHSVNPAVRKDIGHLSLDNFKALPESDANRMHQQIDNLETAYWEYKKANPEPAIQSAFDSMAAATSVYKDMTKELR